MKKLDLKEITAKMVPILRQAEIKKAALFGSYVRGDQRGDSDIDILVDLPKGLSLFDVVEIKYKLEDALGKNVDLVQYHTIKPLLRNSILSEQISIL